jgi:hypothetical protein
MPWCFAGIEWHKVDAMVSLDLQLSGRGGLIMRRLALIPPSANISACHNDVDGGEKLFPNSLKCFLRRMFPTLVMRLDAWKGG